MKVLSEHDPSELGSCGRGEGKKGEPSQEDLRMKNREKGQAIEMFALYSGKGSPAPGMENLV